MIQAMINLYIRTVVLKDQSSDLYKAYSHYTKVCKENDVKIHHQLFKYRYRAQPGHRRIFVPLPTTRENISITYHELGHVLHEVGSVIGRIGTDPTHEQMLSIMVFGDPYEIIYECNATSWAVENSPVPLKYECLNYALQTYIDNREFIQIMPEDQIKGLRAMMKEKCK